MSKKLLFDFACTADPKHVFEELIEPEAREIPCIRCGELAKRLITGTRPDPRMGLTNDFPTAAAKWEKKQRQRLRTEPSADEADDKLRHHYNRGHTLPL